MSDLLEPVLDARAALGEGPVWDDRTGTLLWVDVHSHRVHRFDPDTSSDESIVLGQQVGSVALREDGGLVGAVGLSVGEIDEETASFTPWHTMHDGDRMNDGACDPRGRYLVGTLTEPLVEGASGLFALEPDGRLRRLLADVTLSNGLAWSPDGRTMYYIDTFLERVDAFDYDLDTGAIESRRPVVDLHEAEGRPDGMTVDAEGNLWVAMARGQAVRCYDTRGRLQHLVDVPAPIATSCAFGGPELADLYITTGQWPASPEQLRDWPHAGAIFRLSGTGARGLPSHRFGPCE
ncbi:MAG TPA: SMP-30/gluconolactonase/LRE family protein [Sinomonas sp.]|nr:SMP-30/gluconolactonase/LRE family protein [Sinomonas sp.]